MHMSAYILTLPMCAPCYKYGLSWKTCMRRSLTSQSVAHLIRLTGKFCTVWACARMHSCYSISACVCGCTYLSLRENSTYLLAPSACSHTTHCNNYPPSSLRHMPARDAIRLFSTDDRFFDFSMDNVRACVYVLESVCVCVREREGVCDYEFKRTLVYLSSRDIYHQSILDFALVRCDWRC